MNPSFIKLLGMLGYGRVWTKAEGCHLIDHECRRYLDCLSGFGSVNVGHHDPRLRARVHRLLDDRPLCFCHIGPGGEPAALAEAFAARAPGELSVSLFASSGSEWARADQRGITTEALWKKAYGATDRFDLHRSTFEGNALSCAIAHETLAIIDDEDLITTPPSAAASSSRA